MYEQCSLFDRLKSCTKCAATLPATSEFFARDKKGRDDLCTICRSCKSAYDLQYRARTVSKQRSYAAAYYRANSERIKAAVRQYGKTNRVAIRPLKRARANRRRARKRALEATFSQNQWDACRAHFGGCAYCGTSERLEQDHFVALTKGGSYVVGNIVPACRFCNPSKGNRDFDDWYPRQKFYSAERAAMITEYLEQW